MIEISHNNSKHIVSFFDNKNIITSKGTIIPFNEIYMIEGKVLSSMKKVMDLWGFYETKKWNNVFYREENACK